MSDTSNDDDGDANDEWTEMDELLISPAFEVYKPLQEAFNLFNQVLFDDTLPDCMLTLQKHARSRGYYSHDRFVGVGGNQQRVDVIALNPACFVEQRGGTLEALGTLAHEMCHAWQQHHGTPPRKGYHNKEWSAKMVEVGLQPSNTGEPGGKVVGQKMDHYIIAGGQFENCAGEMIRYGYTLPWAEIEVEGAKKPPTRVTYLCPACAVRVMGKRGITSLECDCDGIHHRMEEVVEATAEPSVLTNTEMAETALGHS